MPPIWISRIGHGIRLRNVAALQTPLLSFHGTIYPLVPYEAKRAFFNPLRERPQYPLLEFIFKDDQVRATYRHDLHPEAASLLVSM